MLRVTKIFLNVVGTVALVYTLYWFGASSIIKSKINVAFTYDSPVAALSTGEIVVSGYPSEFDIFIQDLHAHRFDSASWTTPGIHLTAASLDPTRIELDLSRPHAVKGRWGDFFLDTERAQVIALFGRSTSLPLNDLRLAVEAAKFKHDQDLELSFEKIVAVLKNTTDPSSGVYRIHTEITGADLSNVLPHLPEDQKRLGPIAGVIDVYFSKPWTVSDLTASLPVFQGAILQKLSIGVGESDLSLTGKLRYNQDSTISGEVIMKVTKWRDLLSLAKQMGKIDAEGEEIFAEMLADVEALSNKPGTLELPLVIKNGAVTYGIFTLGLIPPVR